MSARTAAVVPSLGRSPFAAEALARLARELERQGGELVWAAPAGAPPPEPARPRLRWLEVAETSGFAGSVNRALGTLDSELVALVNDDALVEPGWLAALESAFDDAPRLAAAQGVIADLHRPERCDGYGLTWNRWWQAVQLGHGEPVPESDAAPFEPFGVSATACLYRRAALDAVFAPGRAPFDERLGSWYEDVDLAGRLRAAGFVARTVPSARASHAGGATGASRPREHRRLLARNRLLVVMRLLGRRFVLALPLLVARDLADGWSAVRRGDGAAVGALAAGWLSASVAAPHFAHVGPALVAVSELRRWRQAGVAPHRGPMRSR